METRRSNRKWKLNTMFDDGNWCFDEDDDLGCNKKLGQQSELNRPSVNVTVVIEPKKLHSTIDIEAEEPMEVVNLALLKQGNKLQNMGTIHFIT